jgi:tetratricopeptide (TPR) repeat protein
MTPTVTGFRTAANLEVALMKYGTLIVPLPLLVLLAVSAGAAHAQPSGAQAETLFRQGKDLMARGKIAEACAAFDASQRLDPTVATLLNQAACREKNGQLATAWGQFLEAERQTRSATDDNGRQLHQTAANHAAKLEPRLSTLTITVPPESRVGGLQVTRGGEPVDPGAWNRALPVDGGSYKITASAPGNAEWSTIVAVSDEHDVKTVEIPRLKAAALIPPRPTVSSSPAPPAAEHPDSGPPARSKLVPLVVGGGAAVALAGAAIGVALWGSSTYDKAKAEPDNARQDSLWHSANTKRYVAEGLGVASLASAGVAVWLYLRPGEESASAAHASRVHVAPIIAGDAVGLLWSGHY